MDGQEFGLFVSINSFSPRPGLFVNKQSWSRVNKESKEWATQPLAKVDKNRIILGSCHEVVAMYTCKKSDSEG